MSGILFLTLPLNNVSNHFSDLALAGVILVLLQHLLLILLHGVARLELLQTLRLECLQRLAVELLEGVALQLLKRLGLDLVQRLVDVDVVHGQPALLRFGGCRLRRGVEVEALVLAVMVWCHHLRMRLLLQVHAGGSGGRALVLLWHWALST